MLIAALSVLAATLAWFIVAAVLFFNPVVGPIYEADETAPGVRALPKGPRTVSRILLAIVVQCIAWYAVFIFVRPSLAESPVVAGLQFGALILVMKMVPRDIDRVLLSTYPTRRMAIEFVIGAICGPVVGLCFALTTG